MNVFVHHLFEFLDAFNPIVLNRIRQAAENILPIFHSSREGPVHFFVGSRRTKQKVLCTQSDFQHKVEQVIRLFLFLTKTATPPSPNSHSGQRAA